MRDPLRRPLPAGGGDTRRAAGSFLRIGEPGSLRIDPARVLAALGDLAGRGDVAGWIAGSGFEGVPDLLAEGARVFGATIVQGDAPRSRPAQALMDYYNQRGIFSNALDTAQELDAELNKRFANVRVQLHGAVAVFEAQAG